MNKKEIKKIKEKLTEKREDLLESVQRKKHEDLNEKETGDEIDTALQSIEKEMLFELTDNEKIMLDAIETAITKIEKNKYGLCEQCHKLIPVRRLKAMPWARYCISCQSSSEK